MSIQSNAVKISESCYQLGKIDSLGMIVPAKIFISDELFNAMEYDVWPQIVAACSLPGVDEVTITPDTHVGAGVPIGCVAASRTHLYPEAAGYDISCGMALVSTDIHISKLADKQVRRRLIEEIEARIPSGVGSHRADKQRNISHSLREEILRFGAAPLEAHAKIEDYHEREFLPVDVECSIPDKASSKLSQLGSLGGGNHFIEIQVNSAGFIHAMIHTGSRGFGWQIADHFFKMAPKGHMAVFEYATEIGQNYWNLHNMAANFAIANRVLILDAVIDAMQTLFPDSTYKRVYEISHNIIQREFGRFIHRKGATRAFTGDMMKESAHEKLGHPIIIPGSMADGAAVLRASLNAHSSMYSVNHGSGRVMSRSAAKRSLDQGDVNRWMDDVVQVFDGVEVQSILVNSRDVPIDESRDCYKNLDKILFAVESANLAKVQERLWPIAVIKGMD